MQDLLEYTQELRHQLQMLTTGNFAHRLGNIRQIVNALENAIQNQSKNSHRELTKEKNDHLN